MPSNNKEIDLMRECSLRYLLFPSTHDCVSSSPQKDLDVSRAIEKQKKKKRENKRQNIAQQMNEF